MTQDHKGQSSHIHSREKPEPGEDDKPWSILVWMFLLTFVVWGTSYFVLFSGNGRINGGDSRSETSSAAAPAATSATLDGAPVFQNVCAACHQANGEGLPGAFPPLAGSVWVTGAGDVPIRIVLNGLHGPIEVKGMTYNGVMPAFGSQLSDTEIAAVVSYIRSSWGNAAEPVTVEEVKALRATHADRKEAWTAGELKP